MLTESNKLSDGQSSTELNTEAPLKIAVLGMGHVGLPTALGMAELGFEVMAADTDAAKVDRVNHGTCPFFEPGMQELLRKHLLSGRFRASTDIGAAITTSAVLFICVGTPQREDGQANLKAIEGLARTIAANLNNYKLIVEKSTVPAITADWIRRTVTRYATPPGGRARNGKRDRTTPMFEVASNPEFLQEGSALEGFFKPDRIVCGVASKNAEAILRTLYEPLRCEMLFTDVTTAELIKHAANAFLATKISFINMVSELCESVGADVTEVARAIGADHRIGPAFLNAGIGFGGYCLPKDLRALMHVAGQHNVDCSLLRSAEFTNSRCIDRFVNKVKRALWIMEGKTIGVLGLAFKAGTDDVREAPALKIVEVLLKEGANVRLYDPKAMNESARVLPENGNNVLYCEDAYDAATGADALLILTEWPVFRALNFRKLSRRMSVPILVDGRNLCEPDEVRQAGFEYYSMGRTQKLRASSTSRAGIRVEKSRAASTDVSPIAAV